MNKKSYKKIGCMLLGSLFILLLLVFAIRYLSGESGVSDVMYTLELENLPHYELHEQIQETDTEFSITSILEVEANSLWQVQTDMEDLQAFDGKYTMHIANHDILVIDSCSYEKDGKLYINNFTNQEMAIEQLCIVQNGSNKVLAVINLK